MLCNSDLALAVYTCLITCFFASFSLWPLPLCYLPILLHLLLHHHLLVPTLFLLHVPLLIISLKTNHLRFPKEMKKNKN